MAVVSFCFSLRAEKQTAIVCASNLLDCGNFLRVMRPDAVIIGLLCITCCQCALRAVELRIACVAQTGAVGVGRAASTGRRNNNGWTEGLQRRSRSSLLMHEPTGRLFHQLLKAKQLFCFPRLKNKNRRRDQRKREPKIVTSCRLGHCDFSNAETLKKRSAAHPYTLMFSEYLKIS